MSNLELRDIVLHRAALSSADGSAPLYSNYTLADTEDGVYLLGCKKALIDIKLVSGSLTSFDYEVYVANKDVEQFIKVQSDTMTEAGKIRLNIDNEIVFVRISAISGTSPVLDIYVQGVLED